MNITTELVVFVLLIASALFAAWWRVEAKVKEAKQDISLAVSAAGAKADLTALQLAEYKTHVAEHYVSKVGHRESTEQVMEALSEVKKAVDGTNNRIDRMFTPIARS